MIYSRLFAVAAATFAGFASAQTNFTTCCNVSPATVDAPTRASWCRAQMNTCPLLCPNGATSVNTCDNAALTFECQCGNGNTTPNITDYAQTLPSLQCDEWRAQCTAAHPNDLAGQTFCQSFICGTRNATAEFVAGGGSTTGSGAAASSASSTPSGTQSVASSSGSATAAASSSAAAVAIRIGQEYGTGVLAVGALALFGFAL